MSGLSQRPVVRVAPSAAKSKRTAAPVDSQAVKLAYYARAFRTHSEQSGQGTQYPTIRQCARKLRVSHEVVDTLISDHPGEFDRLYWHTEEEPALGDWFVEYYGEELLPPATAV